MKSFLSALQFLTIIPIKIIHIEKQKIANSMIFFPLVGLLLGLILAGLNNILSILGLEEFSINIILVVFLIILTGGIHLDGLADTADAFLSRKSKEEMLAIMRDSRVGVMGVLSLISIILLKIGLLSSVSAPLKTTALLLMCVLSRWSVVLMMFLFPYAHQEGKAKVFIQGINLKIFILSTLVAFVCAIAIWWIKGFITLLIIAGAAYVSGKFVSRKIGGITGDTLGATSELMEVITLFSISIG